MNASRTLKLCFIAPEAYPLFNPLSRGPYADADIQVHELAQRLGQEDRAEVSCVTGDYGQDEVEFFDGALIYRGNFAPPPNWRQRMFSRQETLESQLERTGAEVVIMAGASSVAGRVADFCQTRNRALIYLLSHPRDCDGTYVHGQGEMGAGYRRALGGAMAVVAPTEGMARMLRRAEGIQALVIPPYAANFPHQEERRNEAVWIGEVADWAQPEYFFRLALTLPSITFTMYGRPRKPDYLERIVEKTRGIPNLGFQNSVPFNEMPLFLGEAKLLINTSRAEGFPYAAALAMRLGTPIASLNADFGGLLDERQIGVCARGSEVRMAQETLALCSYDRQWKRFSQNALRYAQTALDAKAVYQSYWKLFLRASASVRARKRRWWNAIGKGK